MRFMILVKADKDSEAGILPSTELLTAMGKYNEQLAKAGRSERLIGYRLSAVSLSSSSLRLRGPIADSRSYPTQPRND